MYLTKEKFNIQDLVDLSFKPSRILVISADEMLRQIYQQHLEANKFLVGLGHYKDLIPASEELTQYDLWILDIVNELFDEQQQWLVVAKNSYPNVKIITLGMGLPEGYLTNLMSAGIVGHIDRKLTRPQDLVLLIKTIINPNRLLQEY